MPSSHNGSPTLQRKATKKSSFLSLRREKKSIETTVSSNSGNDGPTSPSSFQFEEILRPVPSRPMPLGHRSRSMNKSVGSLRDDASSKRRSRGKEKERRDTPSIEVAEDYQELSQEESYEFPIGSAEDAVSWIEPEAWARPHAHSGPSRKSDNEHVPFLNRPLKYPFRDSGSSSLSQFDPPPQTPMDDMSFRDSVFNLPVMVAAPVSGVEAMDALVDGMNGYGGEDHMFYGSRSKFSKSGHHPLYHPPLPTPPPGITLGGGVPRSSRRRHSSSDDESTHTHGTGRSQKGSHRSGASRKPSSRTLTKASLKSMRSKESIRTFSDSSPNDDDNDDDDEVPEPTPTPPSRSPTPPVPKPVIPSISEIIRTHAPLSQQTRTKPVLSRKSSNLRGDGKSTPIKQLEPLPTDEETDLVSRSSVDTIAEEVRQTVRSHVRNFMISPPPLHNNPYFSRVPSSLSHEHDRGAPSPGYDKRRASSIYSHSTSSDQATLPPLDLSTLTKANINSPAQNIAQYLRSSRLTSLLTLTRSPHASRECPLSVSFSDLGTPTGFPIIVFLGLGCVRHLMGLYDEMAGCLGIRLITIDR